MQGAFGCTHRICARCHSMNKTQYLAITAAVAVFLTLYLGFDTAPAARKAVERSRSIQGESTSFDALLENAKSQLDAGLTAELVELEQKSAAASPEPERAAALKRLSGWWYAQGDVPVAGGFAEQAAELENTDSAWSVTGATFYHGILGARDAGIREYCAAHAVKAFESAVSLNPGQPEHRVNLALVYAEAPPKDNPMQAVLMLRELEQKYPENASVYNALGRLAIKTAQWTRAVERLEKAWALDKNNPNTPCLLAKAYEGAGQAGKAAEFAARCGGPK